MSTPSALAFSGAKFIRKQNWTVGKVYIDNFDIRDQGRTWCFIHPFAAPSPNPQPVLLNMLEGDDWEEAPEVPFTNPPAERPWMFYPAEDVVDDASDE